MGCRNGRAIDNEAKKILEESIASQELKALVDSYDNESEDNNQDYYVNVFTEDCHVGVYFNNKLGMDLCSRFN